MGVKPSDDARGTMITIRADSCHLEEAGCACPCEKTFHDSNFYSPRRMYRAPLAPLRKSLVPARAADTATGRRRGKIVIASRDAALVLG